MSVKAMSLVWDLECPSTINGLEFGPNHKFVLLAYADHADHHGKNIWPAIPTIAKKTGYKDRNTQILTHDLNSMGLLVDDGQGPRGTNRWYIPFDEGGVKIAPVQKGGGAKDENSLGAIPSGAIPSGAKITPEFKEPEPKIILSYKYIDVWFRVLETLKDERPKAQYETWIASTQPIGFEGKTLIVAARNEYARDWLTNHITERAQQISGFFVGFVVVAEQEEGEPA